MTGEDPGAMQIDHINQDDKDNRFWNLRLATQTHNQWNRNGFKGYYYNKRPANANAPWCVSIKRNGKLFSKQCKTEDEAKAVATEWKRAHDGEWLANDHQP